ncbi:hypothetical protein OH491_07175 [Termitidicoccus mucosus]|uniref:Uncharacterized protein n=1 Tax=Termitidicoccus mucosus TaxID=1184151 RepID=A0A178IGK1_9BACT|nr:hypothetical protein AW736_17920 [Opitutaceae bacterium TSB47]
MNDLAQKTRGIEKAERTRAIENLKRFLKEGDTVYVILRGISASGMSRCIDLYSIVNGRPCRLTWSAAIALRKPYDKRREALRMDGTGTCVAFEAVYNLAWALFNNPVALSHQWL